VLIITGITLAASANTGIIGAFAASARQVQRGQLWRLFTSGMLAEQPVAASIISFALLAGLTLSVCGRKVFWLAGLAGHVGSAALAYSSIVLWRVQDSNGLHGAWQARDYGVSAVSAAWLGAIAAAGWRARGNSGFGRAAIALSCVAVGFFAYMLRPGLTILSSEHVTAFTIGVALACAFRTRATTDSFLRNGAAAPTRFCGAVAARTRVLAKADPVAAITVLIAIVLMGASMMPSALGALGNRLLHDERLARHCFPGSVIATPKSAGTLLSCQNSRNTALPARFFP
jgi:hypothetical protein